MAVGLLVHVGVAVHEHGCKCAHCKDLLLTFNLRASVAGREVRRV